MVVLDPDGSLFYSSPSEPSPELHKALKSHLREIPVSGSVKFYHTERDQLYSITAQRLLSDGAERHLFTVCPPGSPCIPAAWGYAP